uniref:GRB2-associated-binding protein 2 n=1 Tax=Panagrellus redivivus TaxID=6233 RepID=A0A7E4WB65_PANRE
MLLLEEFHTDSRITFNPRRCTTCLAMTPLRSSKPESLAAGRTAAGEYLPSPPYASPKASAYVYLFLELSYSPSLPTDGECLPSPPYEMDQWMALKDPEPGERFQI